MWIFWMYLEITRMVDSWPVNQSESLKFVIGVSSNPSVMMMGIMWQRRLVSCWFGWPRILGCGSTFQGLGIWIENSSASSPPFINEIKPPWWKSILFSSPRGFASKFFLFCFAIMSSFFFIRWRKERERMETVGMIGAIYQSLWWACHNTSVVVTGLRRQGRWGAFLLQLGLLSGLRLAWSSFDLEAWSSFLITCTR